MKLNKNFIGINYFLNKKVRDAITETLMDETILKPILELGQWGEKEMKIRKISLDLLNSNTNHKLFYITQKVQSHSDLIKFEKINLGWFRKVKHQSSTYILSRTEFYRFYVDEGNCIYVMHFYREPEISDEQFKEIKKTNRPLAEFFGYKYETFVIRFNQDEYPDGFMPENEIWNQNFEHKKRFVKLLLFIDLSEPEIIELPPSNKIKLSSNWEKTMDGKVLNDIQVNVTLVNTFWNKIVINNNSFSVDGHIRIQPYGPGRSLYKPIWIEDYMKSGYIRTSTH